MTLADELLRIEKMLKQEGVPPETRIKALSDIQRTLEAANANRMAMKHQVEMTMRRYRCNVREAASKLGISKSKAYASLGE